jgi:hypothetical protein
VGPVDVQEIAMPSNKIIVDVLMETSQLLQQKGWNKFSMARDPHGEGVGPNSKNASCYCLSGALVKAWRTIDPQNEDFYFKYFEKKFADDLRETYGYNHPFTRWNDEVATCRENVVTLIHSVITSILRDDPAGEADLCLEAPELAKRRA